MSETVDRLVALASADQLPEVRLLRPQPGDVLLLRLDEDLAHQDMDDIAERVKANIPDVKVMVLGPGASLEVVRKDSEG